MALPRRQTYLGFKDAPPPPRRFSLTITDTPGQDYVFVATTPHEATARLRADLIEWADSVKIACEPIPGTNPT